jgi:hypothetical protein
MFYNDDFVENHLSRDLIEALNKEMLNEEVKTRFNFNSSDFKLTMLAVRVTNDLLNKPVFARVIENKYFERIVSFEEEQFKYENAQIPPEIVKTLNNLSLTLKNDMSRTDLINWSANVLECLNVFERLQELVTLKDFEYESIEKECIRLFLNNFNDFSLFITQIDNIPNLSSVIFSTITFKICLKLTPLLATKLILNYNTDEKVKSLLGQFSFQTPTSENL